MAEKPALSAARAKAKASAKANPPQVAVAFRFDGKNVKAQKVAKAAGAKLVTSVTDETRAAIRTVITKAIREGIHPYEAAKSIVGILSTPGATTNAMPGMAGLNTPQVLAAFNYKAGLIDVGHDPKTVDRLMGKYVTRKLNERSVMIARTETMAALNLGAEVGYIQASKQGMLPPEARLVWLTTPDERLCVRCAPMNGETKQIGAGTTFSDGSTGPPKHPKCRCSVGIAMAPGGQA